MLSNNDQNLLNFRSTKNTVKQSTLGRTPFEVHFRTTPWPICRFDATPRVDRLAQYDVDDALQMGSEIIEFSTQTTETTAVPVPRSSTPTLLPLSRMTLCQPDVAIPSADVSNQVDRDQQLQPCSSYSPEPVHGTPKLKFPPRLSLLLTSWMK